MTYPVQFANLTAATGADLDQNFNAALPLAGGTMTGPLSGTSATFADPVAVGAATASGQAVQLGQVQNAAPIAAIGNVAGGTSLTVTTGTFTAPSAGALIILAFGQTGSSGTDLGAPTLSASLAGLNVLAAAPVYLSAVGLGYLPMTAGQQTTVSFEITAGASIPMAAWVFAFFLPLV